MAATRVRRHRRRHPRPGRRRPDPGADRPGPGDRAGEGGPLGEPPDRPQQRRRALRPLLQAGQPQGGDVPGRRRVDGPVRRREQGIAFERCGKLVVATDAESAPRPARLLERAAAERARGARLDRRAGPRARAARRRRRGPARAGDRDHRLRRRLRRRWSGGWLDAVRTCGCRPGSWGCGTSPVAHDGRDDRRRARRGRGRQLRRPLQRPGGPARRSPDGRRGSCRSGASTTSCAASGPTWCAG